MGDKKQKEGCKATQHPRTSHDKMQKTGSCKKDGAVLRQHVLVGAGCANKRKHELRNPASLCVPLSGFAICSPLCRPRRHFSQERGKSVPAGGEKSFAAGSGRRRCSRSMLFESTLDGETSDSVQNKNPAYFFTLEFLVGADGLREPRI